MIDYSLCSQLQSFYDPALPANSILVNQIAALFHADPHITWAGIYLLNPLTGDCYIDAFQGLPACMKIPAHQGVIGAALDANAPMIVSDVHSFPGHIACDARSKSELVIPLKPSNILMGVLDLDSDVQGFFDPLDPDLIEELGEIFSRTLKLSLPF
ncbi:GAF domain-containing protein [Erysipelotrichaceae bacterium 51-3]|uniref:GAF domain-containing protein n=1 Tax=Allobaculum sp. JKK-2023 TaxID=3108943 RepID=UPI002B05DBC8|nr:GAF domain-containing protein [Allobaculum sp. JKK-2023]